MAVLRLERRQMVSSTEVGRRLAEYLDRVTAGGERLFVVRNNRIEAVLLGIEDFEQLIEYEDMVEHLVVADLIARRRDEPEEVDLDTALAEAGLDPDELKRTEPN